MAWFAANQSLPKHKNTLRLAALLNLSRREAVGLVWDICAWALDNADADGNLAGLCEADLALALDFPPKRGKALCDALCGAGFFCLSEQGVYTICNWHKTGGMLAEKRAADRERKAKKRVDPQEHSDGIPTEFHASTEQYTTAQNTTADTTPHTPPAGESCQFSVVSSQTGTEGFDS